MLIDNTQAPLATSSMLGATRQQAVGVHILVQPAPNALLQPAPDAVPEIGPARPVMGHRHAPLARRAQDALRGPTQRIVGVAGHLASYGLDRAAAAEVYSYLNVAAAGTATYPYLRAYLPRMAPLFAATMVTVTAFYGLQLLVVIGASVHGLSGARQTAALLGLTVGFAWLAHEQLPLLLTLPVVLLGLMLTFGCSPTLAAAD